MMRCVLAAAFSALVAAGCALPTSGQTDVREADAGTNSHGSSSGTPPVSQPDSGLPYSGPQGASHDGGPSSEASVEASVPASDAQPGDAFSADENSDNESVEKVMGSGHEHQEGVLE